MAVTAIKSSKVTMYKMVSLPTTSSGTKDSGMKASQLSYRAFTTGLNRIGATINSTIVINKQIRDALVANLKLKDKEFEEEKKRFQKEKEEKNKVVKKGGGFPSLGVGKAAEKIAGGFLEGLLGLGGALMKFVITQSVLRWMGNPANIQKLISIVQAIVNVVTFFARFLRDNIVKMFDGLATMLDGKKNIFEKLGGFVTFITGFGAILGGALILKKPGMVLKGVGWVLKTLYTSLFKTKTRLAKQVASQGSGGFGSWSSSQGAKGSPGGGRGRLGAIAKGAAAAATIAVPLVVGAQMASGPDEFSGAPGSVSGGSGGDSGGGEPHLAMGGVATRPTSALIGEAGPEIRMPLDNAKRMRDSGIKPLSSLGGMFGSGNKGNAKQAQKLSDLFMAPFRGIGAGILANVSSVVSGMGPAGQLLTPILGNIIAPIANSFGVPPSLVKTLRGKSSLPAKQFSGKQFSGNQFSKGSNEKLFGKGKLVKTDDKKFKKVADTSVLGLLSNILAAVQVIGNKAGGGNTPTPTPSGTPPSGDKLQTSAGATGGGAAGATNTAQETIKKAGGFREDGTLKGVTGTTKDKGRGGKEHSPGAGLLPVEGSNRTLWYNESGDVFKWQRPGDPLTDITSSSLISPQELKGTLVRDLKDGKVKLLSGMFGGDQTPVGYFSYAMGAILKKRGNSGQGRSKTGATKDQWEKPTDGRYGPTIKPKASTPSKAMGGWISGPMSGYPVSLDGGGSTAFIGHGTEWVGMKRSSGGAAFVIPYDTPATKNNPGLTSSRLRQAKQGGYALPSFAKGGIADSSRMYDKNGRLIKVTGRASGGIVKAARDAVAQGKRGPASPPCASWVRMVLGMAGDPAANKVTSKGDLDPEKKQWGPNMAASFAGSDLGEVIRNQNDLQPGDIVLHKNTYGNYPSGAITHVSIASDKKGQILHQPTSGGSPKEGGIFNFAAGVRLGGSGGSFSSSTGSSSSTSGDQPETLEGLMQKLQEAVGGLNTSLGYAPAANSVDKATADAAKAKADKDKAAKEATAKANAAAAKSIADKAKTGRVQNQPTPSKAVVLPGPTSIVPIEIAFAPTTSVYQPKLTPFM